MVLEGYVVAILTAAILSKLHSPFNLQPNLTGNFGYIGIWIWYIYVYPIYPGIKHYCSIIVWVLYCCLPPLRDVLFVFKKHTVLLSRKRCLLSTTVKCLRTAESFTESKMSEHWKFLQWLKLREAKTIRSDFHKNGWTDQTMFR